MMMYEDTATKRLADYYIWPIDDLPQPSGQSDIKIAVRLSYTPHAKIDEIGQRTKPSNKAAVDARRPVEYADVRPRSQELQDGPTDVREPVDGGRQRCDKRQLFRHAGSPTIRAHPSRICSAARFGVYSEMTARQCLATATLSAANSIVDNMARANASISPTSNE